MQWEAGVNPALSRNGVRVFFNSFFSPITCSNYVLPRVKVWTVFILNFWNYSVNSYGQC